MSSVNGESTNGAPAGVSEESRPLGVSGFLKGHPIGHPVVSP
jgi:hypothetical protein